MPIADIEPSIDLGGLPLDRAEPQQSHYMDSQEEHGIDREATKRKITFLVICVIIIKHISMRSSIHKRISKYGSSDRAKYLRWIYETDKSAIDIVRMDRNTFALLADMMRERHLLHRAVQYKVRNDTRMWPFFKDCIGAIDGTHIAARVTSDIVARFRGRHKTPTQNVLDLVRFDKRFSYVLAGWEGSANDCTVLRNALERPNGLRVPTGKYFLGDAGFFMRPGFLLPYRGMRYHRTDFSQINPPANAKELFNLRHSSLRTTIECTFGILKQRFRVLDGYNHFPYRSQVVLVLVCCILHNLIMGHSPNDSITRDVGNRYNNRNRTRRRGNRNNSTNEVRTAREMREDNDEWKAFRDRIAAQMWEGDYDLPLDED